MPWQMAPPLIIICGAFTATGLLLHGVDYLTTGQVSSLYGNLALSLLMLLFIRF
jgi:hypothetical protein